MCLAMPARVVELLDNDMAVVAFDTVRKRISLALVEDVAIGDFVLVHVGYALHKVSVEEAERTLRMMAEAGVLEEELEEISA
ncbi:MULTISPECIES: HypC/HybG/HupF family hydrogenase formation chaperone [unclassified Mesorhizobium]|uniref:HypC/HybG/HupF family hydrogenase formation chaperone n=1 Tax=unclassified Mesorhizobium TaxID=325217 RepID=UPI0024172DA9|nr:MULTISPECIES: HypC/HybG/HupF family hydrogenase formation chaperone [unclassified Mesorhizobium]WFP62878.1 HypC/HybG/HupF family hydrogenase formation chaperone [Mesorhizobium sp. WSM4904]WFP76150.1 HypC/HybG/HupF family hydrogenase formation chaperone [Mesorhizobium sp. WSM4906]